MKQRNIEGLDRQLRTLSFIARWNYLLQFHSISDPSDFSIGHRISFGEDRMSYKLYFSRDSKKPDEYALSHFVAMLRKAPQIPHLTINGVNTAELEKRMKAINWASPYYDDPHLDSRQVSEFHQKQDAEVMKILMDIIKISHHNRDGESIQRLLQQKYWLDTPFEGNIKNLDKIKGIYDAKHSFYAKGHSIFSAKEAYNLLSGRFVHRELSQEVEGNKQAWFRLIQATKDGKGIHNLVRVPGSQHFNLEALIVSSLPVYFLTEEIKSDLIQAFQQGDSPEIIIPNEKGRDGKVLLLASPDENIIKIELSAKLFIDQVKEASFVMYDKDLKKISKTVQADEKGRGLKNIQEPGNKKDASNLNEPKLYIDENILKSLKDHLDAGNPISETKKNKR